MDGFWSDGYPGGASASKPYLRLLVRCSVQKDGSLVNASTLVFTTFMEFLPNAPVIMPFSSSHILILAISPLRIRRENQLSNRVGQVRRRLFTHRCNHLLSHEVVVDCGGLQTVRLLRAGGLFGKFLPDDAVDNSSSLLTDVILR